MRAFLTAAAVAFYLAPEACAQQLSKPAIHPDLEYLKPGLLNALKTTSYTISALASGQLPQDCRTLASYEKRNPANFTAYKLTYPDCANPWYFCRENNHPTSINTLASLWSRVPVHTRQWVRHIILMDSFGTDTGAAAYNSGGDIAIQGNVTNIELLIHESGHSLDLLNAFPATPNLSNSTLFINAYNKDSGVPDNYARSNYVEDVAQQCVVATFDLNVSGGYAGIEPNASKDKNQLSVTESQASSASSANGGSLLKPGNYCVVRLQDSPITGPSGSRVEGMTSTEDFAPGIGVIKPVDFTTRHICGRFH